MKQYLLSVHMHRRRPDASDEEMQQMFDDVDGSTTR